ncbi:APC family permease [Brachybacterium hainanense]|uniref:APC family permease n=1 Tax=Brachybacterium hainanense TaxID=1541174 RepID=A0ABV6RDV1_9MICO
MSGPSSALKRVLFGRAFATERLSRERLPKRLALPTFAADALSSVAYAPDEILLTLAVAGVSAVAISPWVALAVVVLLGIVVVASRNIVEEYPHGGGDYEVVATNLGGTAGRVVGSALMVDYVLTVAVSISQAASYTSGIFPVLHGSEMWVAIALILAVAGMNLRGAKESGTLLAVPVYLYMAAVGAMLLVGTVQGLLGDLSRAPSAGLEIVAQDGLDGALTALGGVFLVLRAFSSGCAALTGVEAIGNSVPSFRPPKRRNASRTLLMLGGISSVMMLGVVWLADATGVVYVADPAEQLRADGQGIGDYQQLPVMAQLAQTVFSPGSVLFYVVLVVTGAVLFLAANTAFHGFPNLASVLARDEYLPRQLRLRGDRLAYSNGILALALAASALVWATGAQVTVLIQMYIVGVFVSFSLGQLGMVRHYTRRLRVTIRADLRGQLRRRRAVNVLGFLAVTLVLLVVLITKLLHGAWAAVAIMAVLWLAMTAVHRHYSRVRAELAPAAEEIAHTAAPSRSHAIVLVGTLDKPTLRALGVAMSARHSSVEALTVHDEDTDAATIARRWHEMDLQVPLRVVYSPYRDPVRPVLAHVKALLARNPRDVVVVYIPEFLVRHWWESFLHNHSFRRLGARLAHMPRVIVSTVPWQLGASEPERGRSEPVAILPGHREGGSSHGSR